MTETKAYSPAIRLWLGERADYSTAIEGMQLRDRGCCVYGTLVFAETALRRRREIMAVALRKRLRQWTLGLGSF
jgi:hypothetical protein